MAEAELEKNLSRTFKSFFRSNDEVRNAGRGVGFQQKVGAAGVQVPRCLPREDAGMGGWGCQGLVVSNWPSFL